MFMIDWDTSSPKLLIVNKSNLSFLKIKCVINNSIPPLKKGLS